MAEGIIYPKGVVPRNEDFREAQKLRGEVYNFLKSTMEETAESAFGALGYDQKAVPAGFYGDGNAYGYGVGEGVYNVKVGSKTDSYLEKRMSLGGKRIVVEMHMTIYPESMTVEMHYKNTEDAAFRGFKEGKGGYMINEKIIMNCANMKKFKTEMTKKLKEFAEKEIGFITMTKLGNDDRMEKSTASVVEGLTLSSLFSDDFNTTSNKIMEMAEPSLEEKEDEEKEDLLLGDEEKDEETTDEISTAGAGPGGAGGFGYDAPIGATRKRSMKSSAPFDQPVNEAKEQTQFRKDVNAAKKMIDKGASEDEVIAKYGVAAYNAVNAENEYMEESERPKPNASEAYERTAHGRRSKENRRPTNHTRIIPEGTDGFWTIVPQETLDAYKKNHIIGAPGAEGVEVNSKEEEEYNSGGYQKFPGGKSNKYKMKEGFDSLEDTDVLRDRQKHWAKMYVKEAQSPIVAKKLPHSDTLVILENANPESASVEEQGYQLMEKDVVLDLIENQGYHAMLNVAHKIHQESIDESVAKRWKQVDVTPQTQLNDRWRKLATMGTNESIRMAESVIPDREEAQAPKRKLTESVEGLDFLSRNGGIEEGETVDGKLVVEIEKPNCLAPVFYKVFKEDYENTKRAFVWDFNTGMLVNNPGFEVK
jgi:hypothetical protein